MTTQATTHGVDFHRTYLRFAPVLGLYGGDETIWVSYQDNDSFFPNVSERSGLLFRVLPLDARPRAHAGHRATGLQKWP